MVKRMPPVPGSGFGVPIAGELGDREDGQQDAAQLEDRELAIVHDLRPAQAAIEVPQYGKVARAESDQIGKRRLVDHNGTMPARTDNGPCGSSLERILPW